MLESMAQAAGYLVIRSARELRDEIRFVSLASVDRAHFRRPAFPGDQLHITITLDDATEQTAHVTGVVRAGAETKARARLVMAHRSVDPAAHPREIESLEAWIAHLERRGSWFASSLLEPHRRNQNRDARS